MAKRNPAAAPMPIQESAGLRLISRLGEPPGGVQANELAWSGKLS